MIIAQFLLLFIGLGIIRYLTKLNRIPDYFMAPIILSFCIIGAYATQNNLFDIYTMVILGAAMYVLQKYQFSAAPIALGFILGPIAEEGLLQGIRVGEANGSVLQFFFTGGWNISLIVLVVVTIAFSIWQTIQKRPSGNNQPKGFQLSNLFSFKAAAWLPIIGLSALILVFASALSFEEGVFPQITAAIMVILSVVHYIRFGFRPKNELLYQKANLNFSRIFIIAALVIISLLTNVVGFYNQVLILMLLVSMWVYWQKNKGSHSLSKIMLVSLSFTLFMFLIFSGIVKVPVPTGLPLLLSNIF
jgi:putative tricarboxylic transport membrane protein